MTLLLLLALFSRELPPEHNVIEVRREFDIIGFTVSKRILALDRVGRVVRHLEFEDTPIILPDCVISSEHPNIQFYGDYIIETYILNLDAN